MSVEFKWLRKVRKKVIRGSSPDVVLKIVRAKLSCRLGAPQDRSLLSVDFNAIQSSLIYPVFELSLVRDKSFQNFMIGRIPEP